MSRNQTKREPGVKTAELRFERLRTSQRAKERERSTIIAIAPCTGTRSSTQHAEFEPRLWLRRKHVTKSCHIKSTNYLLYLPVCVYVHICTPSGIFQKGAFPRLLELAAIQ